MGSDCPRACWFSGSGGDGVQEDCACVFPTLFKLGGVGCLNCVQSFRGGTAGKGGGGLCMVGQLPLPVVGLGQVADGEEGGWDQGL